MQRNFKTHISLKIHATSITGNTFFFPKIKNAVEIANLSILSPISGEPPHNKKNRTTLGTHLPSQKPPQTTAIYNRNPKSMSCAHKKNPLQRSPICETTQKRFIEMVNKARLRNNFCMSFDPFPLPPTPSTKQSPSNTHPDDHESLFTSALIASGFFFGGGLSHQQLDFYIRLYGIYIVSFSLRPSFLFWVSLQRICFFSLTEALHSLQTPEHDVQETSLRGGRQSSGHQRSSAMPPHILHQPSNNSKRERTV